MAGEAVGSFVGGTWEGLEAVAVFAVAVLVEKALAGGHGEEFHGGGGFKDSKIQGFKDSKIQGFKDSRIQRFKDSKIKDLRIGLGSGSFCL